MNESTLCILLIILIFILIFFIWAKISNIYLNIDYLIDISNNHLRTITELEEKIKSIEDDSKVDDGK